MHLDPHHSAYPSFFDDKHFVFAYETKYSLSIQRCPDPELIHVRLTVHLPSGRSYSVDFKHAIEVAIWNPGWGGSRITHTEIEQQVAEIAKIEIDISDDNKRIIFRLTIDQVYLSERTPNLETFKQSDYSIGTLAVSA